jgi:hypothetical protein
MSIMKDYKQWTETAYFIQVRAFQQAKSSKEFNGSSRAWETGICVKKGEIRT